MQREFDAILFDLGGVLVELAGVQRMLDWCAGIDSTDELWRRWLHSAAVRRFETGASSAEEFAAAVVDEFALPVPAAQFLAEFEHWPRALFPGVPELLSSLAPCFRLASVSNTNSLHWARFRREWSLDAMFDDNFPSHEIGCLKPDAAYFRHVLDELDLDPARILYVDDNRINIDAAATLGIVAKHTPGFAALVTELREAGIFDTAG